MSSLSNNVLSPSQQKQRQQDDRTRELYNSFKFYHPRNVWLICVLASFIMFFDQGTTFASVQMIREDPFINSIDSKPMPIAVPRDPKSNGNNNHSNSNVSDLHFVDSLSSNEENFLLFGNYNNNENSTTTARTAALSTTLSGIFSCIFMLGFVVGTPIASSKLGVFGSNRLVQMGLVGWSFAVLAVACAPNYYALVVFRFCVGFAEGWFSNLLVCYVDNVAPKASKMMWLAIFYSVMPVATAIGMFVGSEIGSNVRVGSHVPGWRVAYFVEFPVGMILAVLVLGFPDVYNIFQQQQQEQQEQPQEQPEDDNNEEQVDGNDEDDEQEKERQGEEGGENKIEAKARLNSQDEVHNEGEFSIISAVANVNASAPMLHPHENCKNHDDEEEISKKRNARTAVTRETRATSHQDAFVSFGAALNQLICHNADYSLLVIGYACYDFLVTSFGSWAVVMLVQGPYGVTASQAAVALGLSMGLGGVVGTILGGVAIDWLGGIDSHNGLSKCVGFALVACSVGFPFGIAACLTKTLRDFLPLFVPCVVLVTMNTAGLGISVLNVCPRNLRPYATSMMLMVMNSLGDLPAPLFVGVVSRTFFSGDCTSAGTEDECNFLRLQHDGSKMSNNSSSASTNTNSTQTMNETAPSPLGALSFIESTWWWKGECKWNVASLEGEESYCANNSEVNRALLCAVFVTCALIPLWGTVVYRKWNTQISSSSSSGVAEGTKNKKSNKRESGISNATSGSFIIVDEQTSLLE